MTEKDSIERSHQIAREWFTNHKNVRAIGHFIGIQMAIKQLKDVK